MSSTSLSPDVPSVLIVSPALADANNGNWHTASRWARMLRRHCRIGIARRWQGEACDLLIALHARRSAESIDAFAAAHPERPLIVVLTGTDIYRDVRSDAAAQRSLELASHLVALQDQAPFDLSARLRRKCSVVFQSAPPLRPTAPPSRVLRVVQVGHLRDEKDPVTFMRAAARLGACSDLHFEQIGAALDDKLGMAAQRTTDRAGNYRWLGALPRAVVRQHIRRAHLLVSTSRMEGGAQVIVEAAQSGTAVLASHIPGHVGLLGAEHSGWFPLGDDAALAALILRARDDPGFLAALRRESLARAALFDPAEEERRLVALLRTALSASLHAGHRGPALSTPTATTATTAPTASTATAATSATIATTASASCPPYPTRPSA
ncbi:MAG: selenoneine biosynthesis selenosugar synthase SenB [Rhizobacter sp.]